jgi:aspartate/methionine/tyrosine aminotransferase
MDNFSNDKVDIESLRRKAFNYRWATLEEDVIPLTAADPDFPVASEIREAINHYCSDGYFSYCPPEGLMDFKLAIAQWYSERYNAICEPQHILPVNSAAHGLFIAADTILEPGDNAIIPDPVDFLFRKSIEAAGAEVRTCPIDENTAWQSIDALEDLIDDRTKAIFICNPNNPIGKKLPTDFLNDLIILAEKHQLWIVSDEIWADITFNEPTKSLLNKELVDYSKKIVVSGLSKNFGLAGLRIGYVICPNQQVFDSIFKYSGHQSTAFGISGLSQMAGAAAFSKAGYWLEEFKLHLIKMRSMTLDFINKAEFLSSVEPDATYLAFPKIKNTDLKADELVQVIHQQARVALVPGGKEWFEQQSEGHIRICYATSEQLLREAFDRIINIQSKIIR